MKVESKQATQEKFLNIIVVFVMCLFVISCSVGSSKMDSTNYREKITVKPSYTTFYSAKYIGSHDICFPPITKSVCKVFNSSDLIGLSKNSKVYKMIKKDIGKPMYEEIAKLDMEEFQIRMGSPGPLSQKLVEEMIYLTAADLALQLGYPFMTQTINETVTSCASTYSTSTYGTLNDTTYSGRTALNENVYCHKIESDTFIFFKNKSDMKEGVFNRRNVYGSLQPEEDLYFGTSPNIKPKHYVDKESGFIRLSTRAAWQKVYDTSGLSKDLRKKHGITSSDPYVLVDKKDVKADPVTDPLKLNRVPVR